MRERPCFIGLNELRETAYPSVAACIQRTGEPWQALSPVRWASQGKHFVKPRVSRVTKPRA